MKNYALSIIAVLFVVQCSQSDVEWTKHGLSDAEERFSQLQDINENNVSKLGLAWSFDTNTNRGHETTPIVVDKTMYITAPWSVVHALDAITGDLKWTHDPQVERSWARNACCDVVNRGAAYQDGRVYSATIDGRLIALDANSGDLIWETLTIDKDRPYTITGAPRIIGNKVIIGNGGAELGVRGYITAYDTEDGSELWRFYTVPGDPNLPFESEAVAAAAETWSGGKWWEYGGGGTVWDSMAYDKELNLLYIGTGNGSPWNRYIRSPGGGDNLYLSSIVAINPDNGEYVWHYQTTPGDSWDYTATQHMILTELEINGELRKVIMQAPKNGFFYVVDRTNGELISAENFVPMNWATHVDMETGRPVENPATNYFENPALVTPGPLGGHNWQPMSYSSDTGLVYIPAQETVFVYGNDPNFSYTKGAWNTGSTIELTYLPKDPATLAMVDQATIGYLLAWDPVSQKEVWRAQYKRPWSGGVLSTAGNLVFQGTSDGRFIAYQADSGTSLWEVEVGQGIIAPPITYKIDGIQYIAVQVGYGGTYPLVGGLPSENKNPAKNGRMMVFKLNGEKVEAATKDLIVTTPYLPNLSEEAVIIAKGELEYHEHCQFCHGAGVISGGVLPDLRYLDETSHKTFLGTVLGGMHANTGMAAFKDLLTIEQTENIQAYIVNQARLTGVTTSEASSEQ